MSGGRGRRTVSKFDMHRVLITGSGIVSPIGIAPAPWVDEETFAWWAVVAGFDPSVWMDETVVAGTDLFSQFAVAAAAQCVAAAGLGELHPRRTAVVHGTSMGGI